VSDPVPDPLPPAPEVWADRWFGLQGVAYRQLPFTFAFVVAVLLALGEVTRPALIALAVALVVLIQIVAFAARSRPWQARLVLLSPLGHMLALILMQAGTSAVINSDIPLLFIAVVNMSLQPGRRAVVLATLGTAAVVYAPYVLSTTERPTDFVEHELVIVPMAAFFVALGAWGVTNMLQARTQALLRLQVGQRATLADLRENRDELARTSDNLRSAIELALGLVEAATEHAIISTDAKGAIEIFNRGAESMLAYARADAIGTSIEGLYDPEQVRAALAEEELADTDDARLQVVIGGAGPGQPAVREWRYVRSDGTRVPVEVAVTRRPELEQGGEPGYLFVATDVTHRREAERLQDEFIGTISHELRTPLSSVLGYLELLGSDEALTDEQRQYVDIIERNANRLLRLVNDLRISVQVSAGTLRVSPESVDLATAVRSAARDIDPVADAAGVRLEVDAPVEVVVHADPVRLSQAFENLLSNGVKFTRRGGSVTIGAHEGMLADGAPAGVVTVRDTGIGIAAEDLDRLTDWFYRARTARDRRIRGIGVGLPIVKAISDAHGGTLDVESALGEGTTFTLKLPLAGPPAEAAE
jgi:PAS domain S-box-containing protein